MCFSVYNRPICEGKTAKKSPRILHGVYTVSCSAYLVQKFGGPTHILPLLQTECQYNVKTLTLLWMWWLMTRLGPMIFPFKKSHFLFWGCSDSVSFPFHCFEGKRTAFLPTFRSFRNVIRITTSHGHPLERLSLVGSEHWMRPMSVPLAK